MDFKTRGIAYIPELRINEKKQRLFVTPLSREKLRAFLLFWDKITVQDYYGAARPASQDEKFLIDVGFLDRQLWDARPDPKYADSTLDIYQQQTVGKIAQQFSFRKLEEQEPGVWSMCGDKPVPWREDHLIQESAVLLKLSNVLPVPLGDTPFEDIMEFKEKRFDQLRNLRNHLDDVYLSISASSDPQFAERVALNKIDIAASELMRVYRESFRISNIGSIQASIDLKSIVTGGAVAGYALTNTALPTVTAVLGGVAAAAVASLNITAGLREKRDSPNPFEYVVSYHKELFLR